MSNDTNNNTLTSRSFLLSLPKGPYTGMRIKKIYINDAGAVTYESIHFTYHVHRLIKSLKIYLQNQIDESKMDEAEYQSFVTSLDTQSLWYDEYYNHFHMKVDQLIQQCMSSPSIKNNGDWNGITIVLVPSDSSPNIGVKEIPTISRVKMFDSIDSPLNDSINNRRKGKIDMNKPNLDLLGYVYPLPRFEDVAELVILAGNPRHRPQAKVTDWVEKRIPLEEIRDKYKASEIVLIGDERNESVALEGLGSNFFVVRGDGSIQTAEHNVLHGHVRDLVISLCQELGIPLSLSSPTLNDLKNGKWKGAFITNGLRLLTRIKSIALLGDSKNDTVDHIDAFEYRVTFDLQDGSVGERVIKTIHSALHKTSVNNTHRSKL